MHFELNKDKRQIAQEKMDYEMNVSKLQDNLRANNELISTHKDIIHRERFAFQFSLFILYFRETKNDEIKQLYEQTSDFRNEMRGLKDELLKSKQ